MVKKETVQTHVVFSPVQRYQDLQRYVKRLLYCAGKIAPNAISDGEDRKAFRRQMYQEFATAWMVIGKVGLELQFDEFGEFAQEQVEVAAKFKETVDADNS